MCRDSLVRLATVGGLGDDGDHLVLDFRLQVRMHRKTKDAFRHLC